MTTCLQLYIAFAFAYRLLTSLLLHLKVETSSETISWLRFVPRLGLQERAMAHAVASVASVYLDINVTRTAGTYRGHSKISTR